MNFLKRKRLSIMRMVEGVKGFIRTISATPPIAIPDCVDEDSLINYTIDGQAYQDGIPTPEEQIEVEFVGDKTVNIFDKSLAEIKGISDETEFKSYAGIMYSNENTIKMLKPNTQYTISYEIEIVSAPSDTQQDSTFNPVGFYLYSGISGYSNVNMWWSNMKFVPGHIQQYKLTFTTPSGLHDANANYRILGYSGMFVLDGSTYAGTVIFRNIQIEEGNTATPYEPYGYKIPVKASGKNYFNLETYTKLIGNGGGDKTHFVTIQDGIIQNQYDIYYEGAYFLTEEPFKLSAGTYTLSGKINKWKKQWISVGLRFSDGTKKRVSLNVWKVYAGEWLEFSAKITLTEPMTVIGVYLQDNGASVDNPKSTIEFKEIQIEKADTASEYEPYIEPITTNIYLDAPLRKIAEYTDYIDFEKQKAVRNIGETLVTAVAVESTSEEDEMASFYFRIADKRTISDSYIVQVLSSKLLGAERAKLSSLDIPCIISNTSGTVVYFKLPKTLIGGTTTVLANAYLKSNPITAYYIKNMLTETDIVLPKLPTFKGTTVYSVDTKINPSNMIAIYYSSVKGE